MILIYFIIYLSNLWIDNFKLPPQLWDQLWSMFESTSSTFNLMSFDKIRMGNEWSRMKILFLTIANLVNGHFILFLCLI